MRHVVLVKSNRYIKTQSPTKTCSIVSRMVHYPAVILAYCNVAFCIRLNSFTTSVQCVSVIKALFASYRSLAVTVELCFYLPSR